MELGGSDNFSQFLHVRRLDIYDVETLILDIEIPQVDSKVVTADESLAVTVDRDAVDVVSMCVCIGSSWYCCNDCVVVCHSW